MNKSRLKFEEIKSSEAFDLRWTYAHFMGLEEGVRYCFQFMMLRKDSTDEEKMRRFMELSWKSWNERPSEKRGSE